MCIAIYKPQGKILTRKALQNSFSANRDGAGFAYVDNGEVCMQKGFFTFEKFMEAFEPHQDKQAIIHFRIATHKAVNGKNCHPWRVVTDDDGQPEIEGGEITEPKKGLVFIHNGMISNCNKDDDLSDTGNFNKYVLQPLASDHPDFWLENHFKWLIEAAIGKGNKLVFMDSNGEFRIFNSEQGVWDSGVWFSNKSYHNYGSDFFVLKSEEDEYLAKKSAGLIKEVSRPALPAPSGQQTMTSAQQDALQQRLTSEGVEVIDSLDALDARLEELNNAVN